MCRTGKPRPLDIQELGFQPLLRRLRWNSVRMALHTNYMLRPSCTPVRTALDTLRMPRPPLRTACLDCSWGSHIQHGQEALPGQARLRRSPRQGACIRAPRSLAAPPPPRGSHRRLRWRPPSISLRLRLRRQRVPSRRRRPPCLRLLPNAAWLMPRQALHCRTRPAHRERPQLLSSCRMRAEYLHHRGRHLDTQGCLSRSVQRMPREGQMPAMRWTVFLTANGQHLQTLLTTLDLMGKNQEAKTSW